ncbi:hypothetical protein [Pseudomonas citrulli]|uniref:Phage infection protein n=1 Tax=Pseudomonas citrulli TaxID=3064347 RepID=A0ABT9BZX7_9PSED|nr:hypothetical protein [Pseudomonas sp. K18]MDO7898100.1 hypothetical protein [Pseudomonas sp. K18]
MKRQLLMSLSLSLLASTAFALPASEQATPQVKDSHSVYSQTVAEGGRDRLEEKGLVEGGGDRTTQGASLAESGGDRTPQQQRREGLAADGSDRTPLGEALAADGGDRVIERNGTVS